MQTCLMLPALLWPFYNVCMYALIVNVCRIRSGFKKIFLGLLHVILSEDFIRFQQFSEGDEMFSSSSAGLSGKYLHVS